MFLSFNLFIFLLVLSPVYALDIGFVETVVLLRAHPLYKQYEINYGRFLRHGSSYSPKDKKVIHKQYLSLQNKKLKQISRLKYEIRECSRKATNLLGKSNHKLSASEAILELNKIHRKELSIQTKIYEVENQFQKSLDALLEKYYFTSSESARIFEKIESDLRRVTESVRLEEQLDLVLATNFPESTPLNLAGTPIHPLEQNPINQTHIKHYIREAPSSGQTGVILNPSVNVTLKVLGKIRDLRGEQ